MAHMDKKYTDCEWLTRKYIEEQHSTAEIGDICGVSKETIRRWLNNCDIKTRSKSEAAKLRAEKYPETTLSAEQSSDIPSQEHMTEEEREAFLERLSENRSGEGNPMWGVTGEEHPQWKGGKTVDRSFYHTNEWKKARKKALERDSHECQVCGSDDELHVHHITPISAGGPRTDLNNLVTLCEYHHYEWEGLYVRPDTRHIDD